MSRNVIRDGYTRPAKINPEQGAHDGIEFRYRPMLPDEFEETEDALDRKPPRERISVMAKAVAAHLDEWSEVDEQERPVPITPANVGRLPWALLRMMYHIMGGIARSDDVPDHDEESLEGDQKNSEPA